MATIPVYYPKRDGILDADAAPLVCDGLDVVLENDGNILIEIINTTGGTINFEAVAAVTYGGLAVANLDKAVAAGTSLWVGPLQPAIFNQEDGTVLISCTTGGKLRAIGI